MSSSSCAANRSQVHWRFVSNRKLHSNHSNSYFLLLQERLLVSSSLPRLPVRLPPPLYVVPTAVAIVVSVILTKLATYRLPLVVSRSLTVSVPEPSLFVKSEGTRSPLSSSFASSPSNVLFVKSLRISRSVFSEPPLLQDESAILMTPLRSYLTPCRPISVSSPPLSWPFRKPPKPTSSLYSRTLTLQPSTPSVLLCMLSFSNF